MQIVEHVSDGVTSRNWRTNRDYCIVVIGQNTEKSLVDINRLGIFQTPVETGVKE